MQAPDSTFLEISPSFLHHTTCFSGSGTDFLVLSSRKSKFSPRHPKCKILGLFVAKKRIASMIMGMCHYKLPLSSSLYPESCIVKRELGVGVSKYVVIVDYL